MRSVQNGNGAGPDYRKASWERGEVTSVVIWLIVEMFRRGDWLCRFTTEVERSSSGRGVTLTSMVVKDLEFLFLERLGMVFLEADLPHV